MIEREEKVLSVLVLGLRRAALVQNLGTSLY